VSDGKIVEIMEAERYFRQKRYKLHCLNLNPGKQKSGYQYVDISELELFLGFVGKKWGKVYDHLAVQNQGRQEEYQNLLTLLANHGFKFGEKYNVNHHLSHAALSFYTSVFDDAVILSYDGFGNDGVTVVFHGNNDIQYIGNSDIRFGQAYNNLGYIIGVSPDIAGSTAGKTMGLAAYGSVYNEWLPYARKYIRKYRKLIPHNVEGLNNFGKAHRINSVGLDEIPELKKFVRKVKYPGKGFMGKLLQKTGLGIKHKELVLPGPEDKISQSLMHMVQLAWTEEVLDLLKKYKDVSNNICVVGGCALNGITNYAIEKSGMFKNAYFVPNPSDCGVSAGAALYVNHKFGKITFSGAKDYFSPYLGVEPFDLNELPAFKEKFSWKEFSPDALPKILAKLIYSDKIVGVIRGRYEVGPRALGNRSILCNPLNKNMRDILNQKVKHREWYRPFAPVVAAEDSHKYFTNSTDIPYMSVICYTRKEYIALLPSITHIDGSARVQTIKRPDNQFLYDTIKEFEKLSGFPIILNTSFNPRGEPILNFCAVGLDMLNNTDMDLVLIENTLFFRKGREELLRHE
ncbi:hypothetical protein EPO66_01880, partial [bacterium]